MLYEIKGIRGEDKRRLIAVFTSIVDGSFGTEEHGGVLISIPGENVKATVRKEARRLSKDAKVEVIVVTQKATRPDDAYYTASVRYPNEGAEQIAAYKLRKLANVRRTVGKQVETFGRPAEKLPDVMAIIESIGGRLI